MTEYQHVRCLFCMTGHERAVVECINRYGWGRAIFGEKIKVLHKSYGKDEKQLLPLLPSYVFVYLGQEQEAYSVSRGDFLSLSGVIRVLSYAATQQEDLMGRDLEFADWLWQNNGHVETLKAIQIGDRVEIIDDIFKSLRGTIVRMDRRKKSVTVKLDSVLGGKTITLSYEIVQALSQESDNIDVLTSN